MSTPRNHEQFSVRLTLQEGYAFTVDFSGQDFVPLMVDEPPPLGQARGPNPGAAACRRRGELPQR
jgi:hypothetical protein